VYTRGIGAKASDLGFVYEKDLLVFPTFAVIPMMPALGGALTDANLNMFTVLRGEHSTKARASPFTTHMVNK